MLSLRTSQGYGALRSSTGRPLPPDYAIRLAQFYRTSVDYLVGMTDVREPYSKTKGRA